MAVHGADDDLLDHAVHGAFVVDDFFEAFGKGFKHSVGQIHPDESSHQRRAHQATQNRWRLVNLVHGLHHTHHTGHNSQRGQGSGECVDRSRCFQFVVVVGFDGVVHDLFDCHGAQGALRDHHQAHGVANQVQERMVCQDLGIFAEYGAGLRRFDMGFQRHSAFAFERLHDLGDAEDGVQVVVLVVFGPFEGTCNATKRGFERAHAVPDQHAADAGAQNSRALNRCRVDKGPHGSTAREVATK